MSRASNWTADRGPEHFRAYLRAVAVRKLGRHAAAKVDPSDVVQQTLLDATRRESPFRGRLEVEMKCWLRRLLVNNLIDARRAFSRARRDQKREVSLERPPAPKAAQCAQDFAAEGSSPSRRLRRQEDSHLLRVAISRLPEATRTAVAMRHLDGHAVSDIASHMGRSPAAIAGLLKRGLAELRLLMAAYESDFGRR